MSYDLHKNCFSWCYHNCKINSKDAIATIGNLDLVSLLFTLNRYFLSEIFVSDIL